MNKDLSPTFRPMQKRKRNKNEPSKISKVKSAAHLSGLKELPRVSPVSTKPLFNIKTV